MARTRAIEALERAGVDFTVHTYTAGTAQPATFGEAVAAALGVPPDRVFKTLVTEVDGNPVVAIVPVNGSLSLKALARAAHAKRAIMAEAAAAERLTGYVVGGISPFGHRRKAPVFVDASAGRHARIFVSGGQRGLQVELAPADLVAVTGARTAVLAG